MLNVLTIIIHEQMNNTKRQSRFTVTHVEKICLIKGINILHIYVISNQKPTSCLSVFILDAFLLESVTSQIHS